MTKHKSRNNVAITFAAVLVACSFGEASAEAGPFSGPRQLQIVTRVPTSAPTTNATELFTDTPTGTDTELPTDGETLAPTSAPTATPTLKPTGQPTLSPTLVPTAAPVTPNPTPSGTLEPTASPTPNPTLSPTTAAPTRKSATESPVAEDTPRPSMDLFDDDASAANGDDDGNGRAISDTIIIAVAAVGGGVILLLAWVIFLKHRYQNKRKGGSTDNTKKTSTIHNSSQGNPGNLGTTAEIIVPYAADDVSTIGDPAGLYSGESTAYDRQKRIFDDDYSMNTASLERMLDNNTSQNDLPAFHEMPPLRETPVLQDPGECFDIAAPQGKLGVILEEDSDDGVPVVHSIKEESPLVGKVLRGDRLCSIDGEDCTGKTPHEVAKLLKYKENEPTRILTFSRPTQ